jgi:hypothetical protein
MLVISLIEALAQTPTDQKDERIAAGEYAEHQAQKLCGLPGEVSNSLVESYRAAGRALSR